jgi:hypothetical protein
MPENAVLAGTPSDESPGILGTGNSDISIVKFSMTGRHPEGRDAEYIKWHVLDHEPEMHRLTSVRASLRVVSTPACRAARAASTNLYEGVDHMMTYFFTDTAAFQGWEALNDELGDAGRMPYRRGVQLDNSIPRVPFLDRGIFECKGKAAAPRIKVGADVLPWWPALGVYVLLERGEAPAHDLTEVAGVGGAWWASGIPAEFPAVTFDHTGLQVTYCFLDDDPAEAGDRLRPFLEKRWSDSAVEPLFAAPFHTIVRYEWTRHLP